MATRIVHDAELDDAKQQMIASIAHELKSPLTLISGISAQAQRPSVQPELYRQYMQRIQYSSDRLLGLIDSILRGYALDQQMLELTLEPINPTLLLEEVAHELTPHAKKQAQLIAITTSRQRHTVVADRGCLHAVMFNLLDNAIKYSDPEATIELVTRVRQSRSQLIVKDYGQGIQKSDLKRLFAQFGRIQRPVPQWASSTGMGLYIAKQLTEAMQGYLELSRRRDGTSFLVNLQVSTQASLFEV